MAHHVRDTPSSARVQDGGWTRDAGAPSSGRTGSPHVRAADAGAADAPLPPSDFTFTRPQRRMNWAQVEATDVEAIKRRTDTQRLLANIDEVTGTNVYGDEIEADPALRQAFTMAQLSVQYLMHSVRTLEEVARHTESKVAAAEAALADVKGRDDVMKARLRRMKASAAQEDEQIAQYAHLLKALDPELAARVVVLDGGGIKVRRPEGEESDGEAERRAAKEAARAERRARRHAQKLQEKHAAHVGKHGRRRHHGESRRRRRGHGAAGSDDDENRRPHNYDSATGAGDDTPGRERSMSPKDSARRVVAKPFAKPTFVTRQDARDLFGADRLVDGKPPTLRAPPGQPPANAVVRPPPEDAPPPLAFEATEEELSVRKEASGAGATGGERRDPRASDASSKRVDAIGASGAGAEPNSDRRRDATSVAKESAGDAAAGGAHAQTTEGPRRTAATSGDDRRDAVAARGVRTVVAAKRRAAEPASGSGTADATEAASSVVDSDGARAGTRGASRDGVPRRDAHDGSVVAEDQAGASKAHATRVVVVGGSRASTAPPHPDDTARATTPPAASAEETGATDTVEPIHIIGAESSGDEVGNAAADDADKGAESSQLSSSGDAAAGADGGGGDLELEDLSDEDFF